MNRLGARLLNEGWSSYRESLMKLGDFLTTSSIVLKTLLLIMRPGELGGVRWAFSFKEKW